jgi:P-type Mg2+ transporter
MNVFAVPHDYPGASRACPARGDGHLAASSRLGATEACAEVGSCLEGLSQTEASEREKKFGLNLVTREHKATILQ